MRTRDSLGWLSHQDKSYVNEGLLKETKLVWLDQMELEESETMRECFKEFCHIRFGPPMSNNPLRELANLEQTKSMDDCQRLFQSLLEPMILSLDKWTYLLMG